MRFNHFFKAVALLSIFIISACEPSNQKKVGVIVPIEHEAMTDIVAGFSDTLHSLYKMPLKIKVVNAEGDINTQRALIQQMKDEHYDIIAPIGLDATQMTVSMVHDQPIVSIASSFSNTDRKKLKPCHVAVVDDEISIDQTINFIHHVYPAMKNMTLIHSASEKIFPEVKTTIDAGKKLGIMITPLMITSLNELYTTANTLPDNTQAIFILKDSLIVSGINTLAQLAEKKHIPLITSDQGSVTESAGFALGVHERDIGEQAAILADSILTGKDACSLPIITMKKLTVFINESALKKENQSVTPIINQANKNHYKVEMVDKK